MINFVIPSLGRSTLTYSLKSLLDQTDPNWQCWVGFDGISEDQIEQKNLIDDDRIHYLYFPEKLGASMHHGNAGLVRNSIISNIANDGKWIGFLDDDDTLSPYYVELFNLEKSASDFDCCVFRMRYSISNDKIIPPFHIDEIIQNYVGISFCVSRSFIERHDIKFVNNNAEDFLFLKSIQDNGGDIRISGHIAYNVNGHEYYGR